MIVLKKHANSITSVVYQNFHQYYLCQTLHRIYMNISHHYVCIYIQKTEFHKKMKNLEVFLN